MTIAFPKEPIKELLSRENQKNIAEEPKKMPDDESIEDMAFSLLLALFFVGSLLFVDFAGQPITGMVIQEEPVSTVYLYETFNESATFNLSLSENMTSLRVTGRVIGEGEVKIMASGKLVLDSRDIITSPALNNLLTGMASASQEGSVSDNADENGTAGTNITGLLSESEAAEESEEAEVHLEMPENSSREDIGFPEETPGWAKEPVIQEGASETAVDAPGNLSVEKVRKFSLYCKETCEVKDMPTEVTFTVEIEGAILEIDSVVYTYIAIAGDPEPEAPPEISGEDPNEIGETPANSSNTTVVYPEWQNQTINISINFTDMDISSNLTEQINISFMNITNTNITNTTDENLTWPNLSDIVEIIINETQINGTVINDTLFEENLTEIIIPEEVIPVVTPFDILNASLLEQGIAIYNYGEKYGYNEIELGISPQDRARVVIKNISHVNVSFLSTRDSRLSSLGFFMRSQGEAEVFLLAPNADLILECLQISEDGCKRWAKTAMPFQREGDSVRFSIYNPGMYAAAPIAYASREYLPAKSVYLNSDCGASCDKPYDCSAEKFCVMQNKLEKGFNFVAQMDFDIYPISQKIKSAEICSYLYYNTESSIINYIKDSPESFCSDLRQGNSASELISYKIISQKDGWICMDATDIVNQAIESKYSNVFISWLGQDLQGGSFPFTCYAGISPLSMCGNFTPSGAGDCRPYLNINYN